jgi:hypothetical protein
MSKSSSSLNANAPPFLSPFSSVQSPCAPLGVAHPLYIALDRLDSWELSANARKDVCMILDEWFSNNTLNAILAKWEDKVCPPLTQSIPLNVLTYNVRGWGSRSLEVVELIFKVDSPVCVFTEVGEQWNSFKIPHFNMFHQKGTNHSGGVMIAVGKNLKATKIDIDVENTLVLDVIGRSE